MMHYYSCINFQKDIPLTARAFKNGTAYLQLSFDEKGKQDIKDNGY